MRHSQSMMICVTLEGKNLGQTVAHQGWQKREGQEGIERDNEMEKRIEVHRDGALEKETYHCPYCDYFQ